MSSMQNDKGQTPARKPGDRLQHEPKVGDQRGRERRRDTHNRTLLTMGMLLGAILFVLGVWIVSLFHDGGYRALVYIVAAVIGSGIGAGLLPLVSLANQDGNDADAIKARGRRGPADAPLEGAEAVDEGLVPHHAGRPR
jgi:hypothetical protein